MMSLKLIARLGGLAVVLAGLAGCGSERTQVSDSLLTILNSVLQRGEDIPPLRDRLTPEVLTELNQPILLIEIENTGAEAGAQLIQSGGGREVWATLNGIQFWFEDGVLLQTRGLSGDLMSSDISEAVRALQNPRRGAVRVHRYLNGEDQIVARALLCDTRSAGRADVRVLTGTFATRKVIETCRTPDTELENQYWVDGAGTMRKSRQWIGPQAGYVLFERIND